MNERPVEYAFALKHISKLCIGKILDVGSGTKAWPSMLADCGYDITAIDQEVNNRHFSVVYDDITDTRLSDKYQFITCISVLEHIEHSYKAMKNIHKLLNYDGYLVLTFPYNELTYHENIYKHPEAGYGKDYTVITQVYSRRNIDFWTKIGLEVIEQKYYKAFTGKMWTFGERVHPCIETANNEEHQLTCILLQKYV